MKYRLTCLTPLLVVGICGGDAAPPSVPPPPGEYVFVPDTDRWVGVRKGNTLLIGLLELNTIAREQGGR